MLAVTLSIASKVRFNNFKFSVIPNFKYLLLELAINQCMFEYKLTIDSSTAAAHNIASNLCPTDDEVSIVLFFNPNVLLIILFL